MYLTLPLNQEWARPSGLAYLVFGAPMNFSRQLTLALYLSTFLAACASDPNSDAGVNPTYVVSGAIVPQSGQTVNVDKVTLTLTGASLPVPLTTTTGADGKYSFPAVKAGSYSISPSGQKLKFSPLSQSVEVKSEQVNVPDFTASVETATTYKVSGKITPKSSGVVVSGVTLTLTDTTTGAKYPVTSDVKGAYTFAAVLAGTYKLQPFGTDLTFEPPDQTITILKTQASTTPVTAKEFIASAVPVPYTVSGKITTTTGQNVGGVSLKLTGGALTTPLTATSASDGKYVFGTKVVNGTYQVQPSKTGLEFTPAVATVVVAGVDKTVEDLVAYAPPLTCDTAGTWCRPSAPGLSASLSKTIYRIWAASGTDIWFVGASGTILRYASPAAGQPIGWTQQVAGATNDLYAIWGSSADNIWVAGAGGGKVYHYVKGASPTWAAVAAPTKTLASTDDINALWGTSSTGVVQYGGCAQSAGNFAPDGGNWNQVISSLVMHVYSGWASSATDQWYVGRWRFGGGESGPLGTVGAPGAISFMNSDGGWDAVSSASSKPWTQALETAASDSWFGDIRGTSANDIWAVGTKGLVAHYNGTQWDLVDAGVGTTNLYGVWPVSANEVWFAGGDSVANTGILVKYTDAGTSWTSQTITTLPSDAGVIYRVYVDSASKSVWLGGSSGILRYKP